MLFDNPKWLWLLLAALIPLLIHLIKKGNRSVINVGSLQWLKHKEYQQNHKIKFEQFWLWLVRTLIFLLVTFIVAKPTFINIEKINKQHLLLVKNDIPTEVIVNVMDTINTNNWNVKWLDWDLQKVDLENEHFEKTEAIHPYEAFELLAFKNIKPKSVSVLGSFNEHQLKGEIPVTDYSVNWILLPNKNESIASELATIKTQNLNKTIAIQQGEYLAKTIITDMDTEHLPDINFSLDTIIIAYEKDKLQIVEVCYAALKAVVEYQKMATKVIKVQAENINQNVKGDVLFLVGDSLDTKLVSKRFTKVFQYTTAINTNSFISKNSENVYFNFDAERDKVPDLINEMLFKNDAIDKKYNALVSLPINSLFFSNFDNAKQASGFINISKMVDLMQYIIAIILLLILVERMLCRFGN